MRCIHLSTELWNCRIESVSASRNRAKWISDQAEKPNIVYIVLDQWRGDCLGIADSAHPVMTPHFDQLAYEGIWYQRAYADCPICMP